MMATEMMLAWALGLAALGVFVALKTSPKDARHWRAFACFGMVLPFAWVLDRMNVTDMEVLWRLGAFLILLVVAGITWVVVGRMQSRQGSRV